MYSNEEKLKAAYALNLCTVSVSQIVDYADINIMEQEANTILNNLNLERMPNADALRDILTQILDTTAFCRLQEKDKEMIDREYQHQVKNAVWNSIPRLGMIFASGNSAAMALTLATQVGIGYMNYRRNKADYAHAAEQKKWELERGKLEQFYGLQKALFSTAWNLAKEYEFPDEYRLTDQQIQDYSKILMEPNAITRYSKLNAIEDKFQVYPQFWYQMGSTANSIYGSNASGLTKAIKELYKAHALECFEKYQELNRFALLREDTLTAAWALEYIDLLDLNHPQEKEKAVALAELAEKNAGSAMDVIELCAFAQLKIGNHEKAAKLFERMVDYRYNESLAAQILSGLYIQKGKAEAERDEAYKQYQILMQKTNPNYLLPFPQDEAAWEEWNPEWAELPENDMAANTESENAKEPISKETLELQAAKATNVVLAFAASTGVTGAIPIPFADAPLLIAQQVAMMGAINAVFHITVGKDVLKSLALGAIGVGGATVIGRTVATSLIKLIPGAGTIMGGTAAAGTAAALTLALGKAYIGICKSIKMGDLNLDELSQKKGREAFKQAFRDEMKKKK